MDEVAYHLERLAGREAAGEAAGEAAEEIDPADAKSAWEKVNLPGVFAWIFDVAVIAVFIFDPAIPHDERPPLPRLQQWATRMRDARKERERAAGHPILPSPFEFAILELLPAREIAMGTR